MKDTISKAFSLGLGLAVAGKEQIEKTIDELVKKGQVSQAESGSLVDELVRKGAAEKQRVEEMVRERVQALLTGSGLATKADIERLEKRIEELERHNRHSDVIPDLTPKALPDVYAGPDATGD